MSSITTYYDRKHLALMLVQEKRVNAIFNHFVRVVSPELQKWSKTSSDNVWVRNASVESAINRQLLELQHNLKQEINNNQKLAWDNSIEKNDKVVEDYIKNMALSTAQRKGMFARNMDALLTFQNRTEGGLNLSKRVWNITTQTKDHIELFLQSGISQGRSAEAIGRDFRQLLLNPDKRFRRVRNKQGKLTLSQPMKDYHPGRGVYRSSRMNALRTASTETNMAYRLSDLERWQGLDFVLGYEVKRSANSGPCVICDSLVGKYPKDFNFSSFHPFCKCFAVPILLNHEDFADYLLHDAIPKSSYIKSIPIKAMRFVDKNPKYVSKSYFGKEYIKLPGTISIK